MKKNDYFKNICFETSKLSTCISKQVGAVLVKDNRIMAIGYNGVSSGLKHCNKIFNSDFDREKHHKWSNHNELHAEQNIISFCAKNGISINKSTLYVSFSPCINCAKIIIASGIEKVVYYNIYDKDQNGLEFLKNRGIKIENG